MKFSLCVSLILLILQQKPTVSLTVIEYFPEIKDNLTKVMWAHAVNSKDLLDKALNNQTIMMIEADVSMGTMKGANKTMPIMSNEPNQSSDLCLHMFMENLAKYNGDTKNKGHGKGVKLDFKSMDALTNSVSALTKYSKDDKFPIWIHADIIHDPRLKNVKTLDPYMFQNTVKPFTNVGFSFGWATPFNYGKTAPKDYYTEDLVKNMDNIIKNFTVNGRDMTFSVRAGLVANNDSSKAIQGLLKRDNGRTVTIWATNEDKVDVTTLRSLIEELGYDRVYLDVPYKLRQQMNSSGNTIFAIGLLLAITSFASVLL